MTPHEEQQRALSYVLEEMGVDTRIANNLRRYCPKCRIAILTDKRSWALEVIDGQYDEILLTHTKNIGPNSIKKLKVSLKQWLNDPAPPSEAAPKPEPAQATTYTITTTDPGHAASLIWLAHLMQSDEFEGAGVGEVGAVAYVVNLLTDKYVAQQSGEEDDRILIIGMERLIERIRTYDPDQT